jgi:site-specific DNA-methyltransferase (adenine-specific)
MKPISLVTNEDCMEMMKRYPDKFFDLAIVDPEYGIDAGNMTMGKGSRNDTNKNIAKDWDKQPPSGSYFKELIRVSSHQVIWGGNYFLDHLPSTKCFLMWDKMDYNSDFASHELAWASFDKVVKCYRRARNVGGDNKIHPTQKPVSLYSWVLKNYAQPFWKILDTHLGSGSNRIAAYKLGFDFYGCELDADYFQAQEKRFKEAIAEPLFDEVKNVVTQNKFF